MRVFVTGATGYIGSAVVRELTAAGHSVTGLTRLAERASYIRDLGGQALVGDLGQPESYAAEASAHDALIHVAVAESSARKAVDRMALETLLEAARTGGAGMLIYTSGCFVLGETGSTPAAEDASIAGAPEYTAWRPPHEVRILEAATPELATAVIRPGMVYGGKDGAFADMFATAERDGAAEFIGDGANRWSPVYRGDVARLYRLVAESAGRGIFHCAEGSARVGELAMAASRAAGAGGATKRVRVERARKDLGGLADALTMDQVMAWPRSRALGWEPEHAPFIESAESVYREWKG